MLLLVLEHHTNRSSLSHFRGVPVCCFHGSIFSRVGASGIVGAVHIPSTDLVKAITQTARYIYEVEREANSVKFLERVGGVRTVKPRAVLIFGRSASWCSGQEEAFRILNANYHNISIMSYDHVLDRARRIMGYDC